ncbi:ATP-dependent helicase [Helicobacter baculiformis]|uniref:DNA 3'-5' helicase n=1 Tax=Helicobacter baculiformis TaxID=427351 RepID=A0ABV7ZIN1_9HELI|nr:ATP-dependent helicase [Helicobacter baculiformis]
MQLNAEQQEAVRAPLGHNLVIASAGTGKTSTIVGRILRLLEQGIHPQEILLLTFTNKASLEMKERLASHTPHAQHIQAGTFHAVAYRHLKELYPHLGLKQPKELCVLLKSVLETCPLSSENNFYGASHLYSLHSLYVNAQSPEDFSTWLCARVPEQENYALAYEQVLEQFSILKQEHHYLDYNDLLLLYRQDIAPNTLFAEVLCDEYQDTNPLQDSILDALKPKSLFCVGDYDQSIYAFNGADISIISNFARKYSHARVFTLKKNYRSSQAILALASRVIAHNPRIYPKNLEVLKTINPSLPTLLEYDELLAQYKGIAHHIARKKGGYEEVAVLFRNNASADGCEASLRQLGIPSRRKGGLSFFESKEVKLVLDVCAFLSHPKDMVASIEILHYAPGVGASLGKEFYHALQILGDGDSLKGLIDPNNQKPFKNLQAGLFDAQFSTENSARFDVPPAFKTHPLLSHPKITPSMARFLGAFFALCTCARALKPSHSIAQIVKSAWWGSILEKLSAERAKNKDGSLDPKRVQDAQHKIKVKIDLLASLAKPYATLKDFMNAMALGSKEASSGEGVHLLSVHASKGLEFEEVYVIDLMEGRFPNTKLAKQSGSLEEERRLFYVATTRAKNHLYLSYAKQDKQRQIDYEPSCFLREAGLIAPKS